MAIGTDAAIEFFGTQDSLDDTSASVTDATFSLVGDLLAWTNDDDAISAAIVLECTYTVAPADNSFVELYAQLDDIVSTSDQLAPTDEFPHVYLGAFPLKNVITAQFIPIQISLPNTVTSQVYKFFIKNNSAQTMSAGWDIHITPKSIGPHA